MKKLIIISLISFFLVLSRNSVHGQTNIDSLINSGMTLELKNDTLFSNTGLKFFVGQKLIIGNASGEAGQYRSIISKKAAIVPSIWGQDKRFENAIENYVDSRKNKEKVKKREEKSKREKGIRLERNTIRGEILVNYTIRLLSVYKRKKGKDKR